MEEMKVVGFRPVDFTDKNTGKHVSGISLFVIHAEVGVTGEAAEKLFLSNDKLEILGYTPVVGSTISITWGRHNKIIAIKTIKANG